jgi:hypothetical protein
MSSEHDKSSILNFDATVDNPKSDKPKTMDSDDMSVSQLEVMANQKKVAKKNSEDSEKKVPVFSNKPSDDRRSVSSRSSSFSSSSDGARKLKKEKLVSRENKNDDIRKEKSELLCKFSKLNVKGKWSSLRLDMNNSLDDIRNEYERVRSEIQNDRSVAFFKRMLLLGVQGVEMLNNKFDPVGVDLDGWSESMGYSLENQEYDEVLAELYEKYKSSGNMSPEVKLIFMIISSATMFTITKKITKMDSSNSFVNMIGNMMGNKTSSPPVQEPLNQNYKSNQVYNHVNPVVSRHEIQQARAVSSASGTETSDDYQPSKLQGPSSTIVGNDGIDIDNILQIMSNRKKEKQETDTNSVTEEILKNIPMTNKRGRGRPKKNLNLNV